MITSGSPRVGRRVGRLASVRARTTAVAAVVVAIALVVGAAALLVTLRVSLERSGDATALARARDLAALVGDGALPAALTPSSEDEIVQVVARDGAVISATPNVAGMPPLLVYERAGPGPTVRTLELDELDGTDRERFRVWAVQASTTDGEVVVYAARSLDPVADAIAVTRATLLVGVPLLLVVLISVTWWLVGRALRPVEAVRAEVADITEHALDRRVPVPATLDEIARLAQTLNSMLDRLQSSSERQRAFVADASHELQSPLASFRAQLEVAIAHPAAAEWTAVAADLLADTQRLERLARDLLFLAREDAGPAPRRDLLVDLDVVTLDEATRLRSTARVPIDTSSVSAATVRGSRDELSRLVRNLLENAERHASASVRVRLGVDGSSAVLVIEDDGPGVPPDQVDRIFDRFVRLDGDRARTGGGTGLGLAIARSIAGIHGGTVDLDQSVVGGRFVVRLPTSEALPRPTSAARDDLHR